MSPDNDTPCCHVLSCASARDNEPRPTALKAGIAKLAALARKTDRRLKFMQLLRRTIYRPRCNYFRLCRFFVSPPAGAASRPLRASHKSVAKRRKDEICKWPGDTPGRWNDGYIYNLFLLLSTGRGIFSRLRQRNRIIRQRVQIVDHVGALLGL